MWRRKCSPQFVAKDGKRRQHKLLASAGNKVGVGSVAARAVADAECDSCDGGEVGRAEGISKSAVAEQGEEEDKAPMELVRPTTKPLWSGKGEDKGKLPFSIS
jgi:hypothetical protein